jgi:hypothetical protein
LDSFSLKSGAGNDSVGNEKTKIQAARQKLVSIGAARKIGNVMNAATMTAKQTQLAMASVSLDGTPKDQKNPCW